MLEPTPGTLQPVNPAYADSASLASVAVGTRRTRTRAHHTVQLGELVTAAFDMAAQHSADPREVSRLATKVLLRILA